MADREIGVLMLTAQGHPSAIPAYSFREYVKSAKNHDSRPGGLNNRGQSSAANRTTPVLVNWQCRTGQR